MLPTDTLLHALRRMRQLGCVLALVVDGGGRPVGLVTEEELVRAWASGPLAEVGEVMCPNVAALPADAAWEEGRTAAVRAGRPRGKLLPRGYA